MKISINIIPDKEKEKLEEEKKISLVLKKAMSLVAILLLINVVLLLMQIILKMEYKAAKKSNLLAPQINFEKEIRLEKIFNETNKDISKISKISASTPNWARVLVRISEVCPDGIRINKLSVDGAQLSISGFSKTRDEFLYFQDKLKEEGFQFPINLSNLVASQNFNFDLEISIPQDYLIRK